jgi:spore germination protein
MRKHGLGLCLCFALLLTGCKDKRILEELGFTNTTSYDLVETDNGKMLLIANSIPKADPDAKTSREVLHTISKTSKEARIQLSAQTNRIVVSGQLRSILFGMDLAKDGVWEHMDTLVRDPSIGSRVRIIVAQGRAFDILKSDYPQHPPTGTYISKMLEKEAKANVTPEVNLYHFTRDFLDDGIDPVAPIIKHGEEHAVLDGIALFKDDKYVARIEPKKTLIFAFLRDKFKQGEISMDLSEGGKREVMLFSSVISQRKIKVKRPKDALSNIEVDIQLDVQGSVLEYIGNLDISKYNDQHQLERKMEQYVNKESELLIKKMQENGCDSIGIGQYVRIGMKYKDWKQLDWRNEFPNIKVKVTSQIKIKDFGKFQ